MLACVQVYKVYRFYTGYFRLVMIPILFIPVLVPYLWHISSIFLLYWLFSLLIGKFVTAAEFLRS